MRRGFGLMNCGETADGACGLVEFDRVQQWLWRIWSVTKGGRPTVMIKRKRERAGSDGEWVGSDWVFMVGLNFWLQVWVLVVGFGFIREKERRRIGGFG